MRQKSGEDKSIEREIAFHVEEETERYVAQGVEPAEARRRALVDLGGAEQARQSTREVHVPAWREMLLFNLKAALRFMRRAPGFSLAVIVTLALGIGANSAVFSVIDAVVLRPLPFPDGDQLVEIMQADMHGRDANHFVAPVRLEDWNRMNQTFQGISGWYLDDMSETSGPLPEKVTEAMVAPRFLQVMGVQPVVGRGFTEPEEHWGSGGAVLISWEYWQRRFHGDPAAVGGKIHFGQTGYPIVGVMPRGFAYPNRDVDIWQPSAPDAPFALRRDATWFTVVGRMKRGVELKRATADLLAVQAQLGNQFPKPDADLTVQTEALKETVVGGVRNSLWLLYGSVTLLLLIACSNIAALLLARTAEREHEISIRYSLGASRRAIVAQILTEVFALALAGSLGGLAVAATAERGFHLLVNALPRAQEIALNWRVAGYSLATGVVTTLLCGLLPALKGTRRGLAQALAAGGRTQVSTKNRVQWALVGVQVMLAVTLLLGAGLLLRSMREIALVRPGFDPENVLTFQVSGSWGETSDMKTVIARIDRTLEGLRSMPGVEAVATANALPGASFRYDVAFKVDGKTDPAHPMLADSRMVSSGYFQAVRIPLLAGETCREASATSDAMVNRAFVEKYLGGGSAIGRQVAAVAYNDFMPVGIVRGVVGDAREEGINKPVEPTVYSCFSAPSPFPTYLLRAHGNAAGMADAVRKRIHELEPGRSVYAMTLLQEHLDESFTENRLRTWLLTLFAAAAVSLACIGLYGTLSYLVRLRRREVGVRLALGALRGRIVAQFLMQGLRVTALGCAAGVALGMAGGRLLQGMLYGVTALDAPTYVGTVAVIVAVAALALLIPAVRAARVEPAQVLRQN
ncbi:MAG TPA: ABC transporter permease [Terracidiphilus sp.]|jgi:putative ABC transport system permease protein